MSISMKDYLTTQNQRFTEAVQDITKALNGNPLTDASLAAAIRAALPDQSDEACGQISRDILEGAQEGHGLAKNVASNIAAGGTGSRVMLADQIDSLPEEWHRPYLLALYQFLAANYGFSVSKEQTAYLSQIPVDELQEKIVALSDAFSDEFTSTHVQSANGGFESAIRDFFAAQERELEPGMETYSKEDQARIASAAVYVAARRNPGQSIDLDEGALRQISRQMSFWSRAGHYLMTEILPAGIYVLSLVAIFFTSLQLVKAFDIFMLVAGALHVISFLNPVVDALFAFLGLYYIVAIPFLILAFGDAVAKFFANRQLPTAQEVLRQSKGMRLFQEDCDAADVWAGMHEPNDESFFQDAQEDEEQDEIAWREEQEAAFPTLDDEMDSGLLPV